MGNVILGNYDFSPSSWIFLPERQPILDYATVMYSKLVLCLNPPPLLIEDEGILLDPFHKETWISILMVLTFCALILALIYFCNFEASNTVEIILITLGFFHIVVYSAYGGALTSFFVTHEYAVPFPTIRDALNATSDWKIIFDDGDEMYLLLPPKLVGQVFMVFM